MTVPTPSLEDARRALIEAEAQQAFWQAHSGELLQKYPDQFVAVKDGAVVATSPDLLKLVEILETKELDVRDVWIRFMTADPRRLIL